MKIKAEEEIKIGLNIFTKIVNDNVSLINKTIAHNTHIINEISYIRNKEVKTLLNDKVAKAENDLILFVVILKQRYKLLKTIYKL